MKLFSPQLRNKVLQLTYRPKSGKTKSVLTDFGKTINDGFEEMFMIGEKSKEEDENDKS